METQIKTSSGIKDLFINLGAIIALGTTVGCLVDLLFTVINKAYPFINGYNYYGTYSISWPVATIIISFPIYILLMWFLEKEYKVEPERQNSGIHKWLTYITIFLASITIAIDFITVLYYFIDGQELTTGFLLKVLVLFIIASGIFLYYISDIRGKLTSKRRIIWRIIAVIIVVGSIAWGFTVLGSPRTQQLFKYDEQKASDLQNINNEITNYYSSKGTLPASMEEIVSGNYYISKKDPQFQKPYEYQKTSETTYNLCADFNKESSQSNQPNIYSQPMGYPSWTHSAGHYCFAETINPNTYSKPYPAQIVE